MEIQLCFKILSWQKIFLTRNLFSLLKKGYMNACTCIYTHIHTFTYTHIHTYVHWMKKYTDITENSNTEIY